MALYTWKDGELVTAAKLNAYGEGLEQMKEDAESAKTAAESAKTAAESAKTAAAGSATEAESAKTAAESAKTAAAGSATEAESAKTAAESAKTAAAGSATEAAASKEAAETANSSAQSAKTAAETAAQSAESAKTSAAGSASSAADDAQRAEDAVAHNPTIQSGVWYVWDPKTEAYISTNVPATGQMTVEVTYQQGDSATMPPKGAWLTSPPEVAQGKYLWTKTLFSDGTVGYSVARQGMDGTDAVISVNGKSGEVTITADDIEEGSANKYVTAAEKDKIANLPENTDTALSKKVDKVTGKGLSTNDYTNTDKGKVDNLPNDTDTELSKKADKPITITGTLTAGSTSLVLSNSAITTDSTIDIYTDKWGVNPTDVVVVAGKVTLTFDAQAAALNVKVEVR